MSDIERIIADIKSRSQGRTRYEGQQPYADELLVNEIERLRAALAESEEQRDFAISQLANRMFNVACEPQD